MEREKRRYNRENEERTHERTTHIDGKFIFVSQETGEAIFANSSLFHLADVALVARLT